MRKTLVTLAVAALAAACQPTDQSTTEDAPVAPEATTPTAAEAPAADTTVYPDGAARWMASQDGENRFLAYAVPETDDVRFSLECGPNERFVRLWRETWEGDESTFQLASGEVMT